MTELLTAAQMREIEQAAIASGAVTGLELMERAGRGVVDAVFEEWPELAANSHRAVVLCGPGNNGGDGFVVARLLKEWGWEVEVFLYGDATKLPPDAKANYERWVGMGGIDTAVALLEKFRLPSFDANEPNIGLFIDACFGIGLRRPLAPPISQIAFCLNDRDEPLQGWIVSIDIPSGLDSDTGNVMGDPDNTIFADLTVTFHKAKKGHVLSQGSDVCGKLIVKDIGLRSPAGVDFVD